MLRTVFSTGDVSFPRFRILLITKLPCIPGWLQVARGQITVNGVHLQAGDGAAISDETGLTIQSLENSEILLFDLG